MLGIIGACRQWVVHDHWKPYFAIRNVCTLVQRTFLRELKFLWEEQQEVWGSSLSELLLEFLSVRQKHGALSGAI